jgi:UDP-N-acetylglucosamine:LPS N-acetylglucosamine transferase
LNHRKVLILSSDTGGGHGAAARAIEAGLQLFTDGVPHLVHIARVLEECSLVTRSCAQFYNYLLRHHQAYVKYYHWAINKFSIDEKNLIYRQFLRYGHGLMDKVKPNIIVSVHPMMQHGWVRFLRDLNLLGKIPLVTVVTDPCGGMWNGWANPDVDLYLVATERAQAELEEQGIRRDRIKIVGIPVHPNFQEVDEDMAFEARSQLGLDPSKFTLFINAGWVGGGNVPEIFHELIKSDLDIQAVFVAGKNTELKKEAEEQAKRARFPIRVLGFTDHMEQVMSAASMMISKLGGLTTFEALASRVPIIADLITPPMPQEKKTVDLISEHRAGVMLKRSSDIVPIIQDLLDDPNEFMRLREAAGLLATPDATKRIVKELSELMNNREQTLITT